MPSQPFEFRHTGYVRRYRLHRPPDCETELLPLVVFLHGKGGTAEWAEQETGWSALANRERFVVLYPEALPPRPDKLPKFLTNPPTWNDGSPRSHESLDDVTFLSELIRSIPASEVYLCGFSNGAAMTFRLAADPPSLFRAIAPVAGYCWVEPAEDCQPLPTCYLIGDTDPLIPLSGGKILTPWRTEEDRPAITTNLAHWWKRLPTGTSEEPLLKWTHFDVLMRLGMISGLGHH